MKSLYPDVLKLIQADQRFALATVVHTRGSTPQKPGAKAVFLPDGRVMGTIGGGCLEAETRIRALDSIQAGHRALYEMHLDDDFGWDDGLICGGTAKVFVDSKVQQSAHVFQSVLEAIAKKRRVVLAMITEGPDTALLGVRLLLENTIVSGGDGEAVCETVASDGHVPDDLQNAIAAASSEVIRERQETTKRIRLNDEEYAVYFEPLLPKPTLLIAGGGHVGAALCKLGAFLSFDVTVVDDRPDFANPARLPDARETICDDVVKTMKNIDITPDTYIVIVTRGHRHDALVLRECIHSPAAYIGMIGSKRKILVIREGFLEEGVATEDDFKKVHAPIGLDIGSETVEEIALSIAAELVLVRSGAEHAIRGNGGGIRKLSDAIRERPSVSARIVD